MIRQTMDQRVKITNYSAKRAQNERQNGQTKSSHSSRFALEDLVFIAGNALHYGLPASLAALGVAHGSPGVGISLALGTSAILGAIRQRQYLDDFGAAAMRGLVLGAVCTTVGFFAGLAGAAAAAAVGAGIAAAYVAS